ncbi:OOP family OmpA-OmpF porin [Catalinimonas alkaloidigena]|uniref:OmpA family protein n=1 Tax=Catalinimonas alkaloidigena TaxID=1075417 RepID=UPI0024050D9A|nr:OmpA family protein [Catalinimonas alkaloidigena]MDF9797455.1 OOP family OmpA-OmpF porin [Catalinimonas alkaloidigena]
MKYWIFSAFVLVCIHVNAQNELEKLPINSQANEQNPILSPDGQTLYFVRQNHAENEGKSRDSGDIWSSQKQADGSWSEPKNERALNNQFFNSIVGFAEGGNKVYLVGHYLDNDKKPMTQGVSYARKEGGSWSKPKALKIPYFYTKSEHLSASLHSSGQIMVLTLQSYDTKGAEDLYVLFRQGDGSWSEPKNLGSDINTPYQEMTPYLAPDGKTLFFASNGYEGFGSRDIFMSVRLGEGWNKWSNPKNLGARVNTEGTELYYYLPTESEYAYLSSTQNSDGLGDLNRVRVIPEEVEMLEEVADIPEIPEEDVTIEDEPEEVATTEVATSEAEEEEDTNLVEFRGQVMNQKTGEIINAEIILTSLKNDFSLNQSSSVDDDGFFTVNLVAEQDYEVSVEADGFIRKKDKILLSQKAPIDNSDIIVRNFSLSPIEVGTTVNLENVLFDRGTSEMLSGSSETLDEVVEFLNENPNVVIEVSGHTDNRGRPDLNLILSQERAEAVKRYLVEQGIKSERIQEKGYGGTKPIASNAIEEERQKNRRVEFTILEK